MDDDFYSYSVAHGMDPDIRHPATINIYESDITHNNLNECIRSIQRAMDAVNRSVYGNLIRTYAIDPHRPSEVDDCIGKGSEDAQYTGVPGPFPVIYINITDVAFLIDNLPPAIRDKARAAAYKHGATRYKGKSSFPMWLKELIDYSIVGFPKVHSELAPVTFYGRDGAHRVPCVTFMVPYNKITGKLDFDKSQIRFTTIPPPCQYTYSTATDILSGKLKSVNVNDTELKLLLEDLKIIANANAWRDPNGDDMDVAWMVSICMNIANIIAAHHIEKLNLPAIYRHKYDSGTDSQNSLSKGIPIAPLNDFSSPKSCKVGYVRVTSPARRFEDYINLHILYCALVLRCAPPEWSFLYDCLESVIAVENEIYSKKIDSH